MFIIIIKIKIIIFIIITIIISIIIVLPNECLYILELTVGLESSIRKNSHWKHTKYKDVNRQREHLFSEVKYITLSVSAQGVFDQQSQVSKTC